MASTSMVTPASASQFFPDLGNVNDNLRTVNESVQSLRTYSNVVQQGTIRNGRNNRGRRINSIRYELSWPYTAVIECNPSQCPYVNTEILSVLKQLELSSKVKSIGNSGTNAVFMVGFKDQESLERLLEIRKINVKGKEARCSAVRRPAAILKLKWVPTEIPNAIFSNFFAQYGRVKSVQRVFCSEPEFSCIELMERKVIIDLEGDCNIEDIPDFMFIGNQRIAVTLLGMPPVCLACHNRGHIKRFCPNTKVERPQTPLRTEESSRIQRKNAEVVVMEDCEDPQDQEVDEEEGKNEKQLFSNCNHSVSSGEQEKENCQTWRVTQDQTDTRGKRNDSSWGGIMEKGDCLNQEVLGNTLPESNQVINQQAGMNNNMEESGRDPKEQENCENWGVTQDLAATRGNGYDSSWGEIMEKEDCLNLGVLRNTLPECNQVVNQQAARNLNLEENGSHPRKEKRTEICAEASRNETSDPSNEMCSSEEASTKTASQDGVISNNMYKCLLKYRRLKPNINVRRRKIKQLGSGKQTHYPLRARWDSELSATVYCTNQYT